jgi:hypothetical protein
VGAVEWNLVEHHGRFLSIVANGINPCDFVYRSMKSVYDQQYFVDWSMNITLKPCYKGFPISGFQLGILNQRMIIQSLEMCCSEQSNPDHSNLCFAKPWKCYSLHSLDPLGFVTVKACDQLQEDGSR